MPRQHASRPVLQLLAIALLALLSVAAADTKSYGPTPTNNRKPTGKRLVSFMVSEGDIKAQYPTSAANQAIGSTAVYTTDLVDSNGNSRKVGSIVWTGTYIDVRTAAGKVYQVQCDITSGDYQGTLTASGIGGGVLQSPPVTVIVSGGTGAFEGATGTITWGSSRGSSGEVVYSFKLALSPTAKRR